MPYSGVLDRYRAYLDIPAYTAQVTLLEGNTPLIPMPGLSKSLGGGFELWVKFEGLNPTGSFKDRGMTIAVGEAAGRGVKTVICASTGNTAASAAAYAGRAGMRCIVLIPQGKKAHRTGIGAIAGVEQGLPEYGIVAPPRTARLAVENGRNLMPTIGEIRFP